MKEWTATEASRNFAKLLDEAAAGESIAVVRGGERVALVTPAPRANGKAVLEAMKTGRKRIHPGAAEALHRGLEAVHEVSSADLDTDPWSE
ncbi:type II toxin-antitoxin system Phd/YefM family antitoxin [Sciscionella sediminilitoris]|uniref:type II toxin-antitoxin system Phd/YefM family antitoxin n=1 Tax=Sciscionella sediminilitoris TaxID=1445613 RepID=UPI00056638A8|nr:type II toxin-antitoxin system prevent-host-death family antitoxin [Sciscionella sp. SE31]